MPILVSRLQMVTPFNRDIGALAQDEQLLLLKGCALCRITRQIDQGSTRNKPEWKECKTELGVPIDVFTWDVAPSQLLDGLGDSQPPAIFAVVTGSTHLVLDKTALERCRGSVDDLRGRLAYRLAQLGLALPARISSRPSAL